MAAAQNKAKVDAALIAGIQGQCVRKTALGLLADHDNCADAQAAIDACVAISRQMRDLRQTVWTALHRAGIDVSIAEGPEDEDALQFHATTLIIPRRALPQSITEMKSMGFRTSIEFSEARLKIVAATATAVRFVRFDATSQRVDLKFSDPPPSRLPAALHPRITDLGMADLPKSLAAGYWILRPLRIIRDKVMGTAPRVGKNDLLGTPESLIPELLRPLELEETDVFVDLGCGDGRIVEAAAETGCTAIGYEIDAELAQHARARSSSRTTIVHGSAETADLSDATVIFLFLPPHLMEKFLPEIQQRVTSGTRIISHEQIKPKRVEEAEQVFPVFGADAMSVAHIWRGEQL